MNKFFDFLEKNKGVVLAVLAVLIVAVVSFGVYKLDVANDAETLVKSNTIGGITSINDQIEIKKGQTLEQNYKCDSINYKQIGFVANAVTEDAEFEVIISDGKQTQRQTFKAGQLSWG